MFTQHSKKKLFAQISIVVFFTLFAASSAFSWWFSYNLSVSSKQLTIEESLALGKSLSATGAGLLLADRYTEIENLLKQSQEFKNISSISMLNNENIVIAEMQRNSDGVFKGAYSYQKRKPPKLKETSVKEEFEKIVIWMPVQLTDITYGWLNINVDLSFLREMIRGYILKMLSGSLIILILSLISIYVFLKPRLNSLEKATKFANTLATQPGKTINDKLGSIELDVLGKALNNTSLTLCRQEKEIEAKHFALSERIKELHGIYTTSKILVSPSLSIDDKLQNIANQIPKAFQFPEQTSCRLIYQGTSFVSQGFKSEGARLGYKITNKNVSVGLIEIYYSNHSGGASDVPFLLEEEDLLDEIGTSISNYIRHYETLRELEKVNETLETKVKERTQELEEANAAKSEFLSRVSHELRTPMNAIIGFATLLHMNKNKNLLDDQIKNLDYILESGEHLMELVNEILDLTKIEKGKLELNVESIFVDDVINEILPMMNNLASENNITIKFHEQKESIRNINVDKSRLKQILINLISNAIKYNNENGMVQIRVINQEMGTQKIQVIDTGRGISANEIEKIFEPFERLSMNSLSEGTGLGLTIVKHLVESMGGKIYVDSTIGKGSIFTVEFSPITN